MPPVSARFGISLPRLCIISVLFHRNPAIFFHVSAMNKHQSTYNNNIPAADLLQSSLDPLRGMCFFSPSSVSFRALPCIPIICHFPQPPKVKFLFVQPCESRTLRAHSWLEVALGLPAVIGLFVKLSCVLLAAAHGVASYVVFLPPLGSR